MVDIIEGLFSLIVVGGFMFWIIARVRGKSFMKFYNETIDGIMGETKNKFEKIEEEITTKDTMVYR